MAVFGKKKQHELEDLPGAEGQALLKLAKLCLLTYTPSSMTKQGADFAVGLSAVPACLLDGCC